MVTALIPYYNASKTIERTINSLLQQSMPPDEIIIVNDGSSEEHYEVLIKLEVMHPAIKVLKQKNAGCASARNLGIFKSNHPYILMLDADDTFEPSFISKAFKILQNDCKVAVVSCGVSRIIEEKVAYTYFPKKTTLKECLLNNITPSCALFRKDSLISINCYDVTMTKGYEDWDLNIRLLEKEYKFYVIPEVLFNYYDVHDSLLKTSLANDIVIRKYLLLKHHDLYEKNMDIFIDELKRKNEFANSQIKKIKNQIDFKVGSIILHPFRWIKRLLVNPR